MPKTIAVELKITDEVVCRKTEKIVNGLKIRYPEVKDLLVSSGKLTSVGKVLVCMEMSREADHQYQTDIQQGGLGVSW